MNPTPVFEILRRIRPLSRQHQAAHLHAHIAAEQGGNIHRTSVRIRELQAALADIQLRRLKREGKAA